nr:hypothetical protein [Micromonospora sp. KC207]
MSMKLVAWGVAATAGGHLQIVVCAASPALDVTTLINAAHEQSWTTPAQMAWTRAVQLPS